MEFTDRYQALGIPYPNPETVCQGQCEGTGWLPTHSSDGNYERFVRWESAHLVTCSLPGRLRNFLHGLVTFDGVRLRLAAGAL